MNRSPRSIIASLFFIILFPSLLPDSSVAQTPNDSFLDRLKVRPPSNFKVFDTPNDNGGSLSMSWQLSPDDNLWGKRGRVERYVIGRRQAGEKEFAFITTASPHSSTLFDNSVEDGTQYEYVVAAYPFKNIFAPVPWNELLVFDQVERLKLTIPWLAVDPQAVMLSLLEGGYGYYHELAGYTSPMVAKSIWENFDTGPALQGPAGFNLSWMGGQLLSPLAPILAFAGEYAKSGDPFRLTTLAQQMNQGMLASSDLFGPVKTGKSWFDSTRLNVFILAGLLCFFILFFIRQAMRGKQLFIRKIAGLDAVEEAVGRATEMGKEIFYIPGTQDMENIETIAGVVILGRVARLTAELETKLEVPVSRSLVMVTAREIVKEAYANAGRPEAFHEDMVHYLTDDQFGYAAALDGKMVRQRPATIFYMGCFYAESLILAETGNSIGAIQIAGTAQPAQLPFFVAACDYTLIGEELFAASAYLSREPKLLGSLKGQDMGKALLLLALVVGVLVQTFGWFDFASLFN